MAHPYHHALRSAKLFGGKPEDYLPVHNWFDESKAFMPDLRIRFPVSGGSTISANSKRANRTISKTNCSSDCPRRN
jgi:hypothetical protein